MLAVRPAEYDRFPWLDLSTGEEELGAALGERLLHQVVLAHGNAGGEEEEIAAQSLLDPGVQRIRVVTRNAENFGSAARGLDLCSQGVAVGIADLVGAGLRVHFYDFIAGGEDGNFRTAKDPQQVLAHRGGDRDGTVINAYAWRQQHLAPTGF